MWLVIRNNCRRLYLLRAAAVSGTLTSVRRVLLAVFKIPGIIQKLDPESSIWVFTGTVWPEVRRLYWLDTSFLLLPSLPP